MFNNHELNPQLRAMAAHILAQASKSQNERLNYSVAGYRYSLAAFPAGIVKQVQIRAGFDGCPSCKGLVGKRYDLAEAMNTDVLPNLECERWKRGASCCAHWAAVLSCDD